MKAEKFFVFIFLATVLFLAGKHYLGYHCLHTYKDIRSKARSIESGFTDLEESLKKAVWFSNNPLFYKEMARLYFEMAFVENEFGTDEKRDFYLDQAKEALIQQIKRNPLDAFAYYEIGKVYMLYNFPLLTYMDKGRIYFKNALEINPSDGFLNLNILYTYLSQWEFLEDEEKKFVSRQLLRITKDNDRFMTHLQRRWEDNLGNTEKLREILSNEEELRGIMSE